MIPLKLSIHNFLSYGATTQIIDFTPYKLICLSGKNGHGKSALLDALTWALWGQARKVTATTKPDQGLLKLGQTDMVVTLDFIFNAQQYRVKRMFTTKYGKPTSNLEFGIYSEEAQSYRSLSEKTIRRTQDKIEQTIGIDFESFINSSFLRQGQSNEFSKKLPKDRKDILASILGLHRYEKAKKVALEKIKILTQEKEKFEKISEHLTAETNTLATIQEQLALTTASLATLTQQEKRLGARAHLLEEQRAKLYERQATYKVVLFEQEQNIKQQNQETTTFKTIVAAWKKAHKEQLALPDRTKIEAQKQQLQKKLATCQLQYQQLLEQKERLLNLKEQEQQLIAAWKKETEATIQEQQRSVERLSIEKTHSVQKKETLEKELQQTKVELAHCQSELEATQKTSDPLLLINDTAVLEKQFERQKQFYLQWIEQGKRVSQDLRNLTHKKELAHNPDNPSCPLCEQNLSLARKRFLYKKFDEQETFYSHRIARLKHVLAHLKGLIEQQKKAIAVSKQSDELLQKQTRLTATITEQTKALQQCATIITNSEKEYLELKKTIALAQETALKTFTETASYQELKTEQKKCETLVTTYANSPVRLKELTSEQQAIDRLLEQWSSKDEERAAQQERKKAVHSCAIILRKSILEAKIISQKAAAFVTVAQEEQTLTTEETLYRSEVQQSTKEKEQLLQQKATLEAEIKKIEQQRSQAATLQEQAQKVGHELMEYQAVAQAFGKDGIQALLIEDALPEIELEANDLLSRLTDNQSHIFIESLRDLKKGGVKETLDINISDNSGIRPYELFSGGEAFRIDFSLRIAISKLLARRAGTSLQTLIIDEGFGSQDEEGLTRIMDAIYKIQDDFEKIIIVSHLPMMKDQFPVQFMIEKSPHGSRVMVREQG